MKRSAGEELLRAIRKLAGGGVYFDSALATRALCDELAKLTAHGKRRVGHLTEREEAVLRLIAWGHTNKEIAARLSLSPKTIESYKGRFGKKLGLHGRTDMGLIVDQEHAHRTVTFMGCFQVDSTTTTLRMHHASGAL